MPSAGSLPWASNVCRCRPILSATGCSPPASSRSSGSDHARRVRGVCVRLSGRAFAVELFRRDAVHLRRCDARVLGPAVNRVGCRFGGQFLTAYTRSVGPLQLRTVSALLMSIVLVSPVLGAVCNVLCVEDAFAHHGSSRSAQHRATSPPEADDALGPSHAELAAHHHQSPPASPGAASDAPAPRVEWTGRCCNQPAAFLVAIRVTRHELPSASPSFHILPAIRTGSGDVGRAAVAHRDASPPLLSPQRSALVLRI